MTRRIICFASGRRRTWTLSSTGARFSSRPCTTTASIPIRSTFRERGVRQPLPCSRGVRARRRGALAGWRRGEVEYGRESGWSRVSGAPVVDPPSDGGPCRLVAASSRSSTTPRPTRSGRSTFMMGCFNFLMRGLRSSSGLAEVRARYRGERSPPSPPPNPSGSSRASSAGTRLRRGRAAVAQESLEIPDPLQSATM